jgi:Flp pilus assembly protein TadG
MSRFLRIRRDDRGVVALEVVLAMPILIMLIIGTVVLGNFLRLQAQATGEARDGARDAALGHAPRFGTITAGGCGDGKTPDDWVTVTVTKTVDLDSVPLFPDDVLPLPNTITETVTMRCGG